MFERFGIIVTETNLSAVVDAVAKPRKASVSLKTFSDAVIKAAGTKTPAELAGELGMEVASFNQRLVGLRKLAKTAGVAVPALKDARTGNSGNKGGGNVAVRNSVIEALRNAGTVVAEADATAPAAE